LGHILILTGLISDDAQKITWNHGIQTNYLNSDYRGILVSSDNNERTEWVKIEDELNGIGNGLA